MTENEELELMLANPEELEAEEDIKLKGVFLFLTTIHSLDPLSDEAFGAIIRAIAHYAETGVLPDLESAPANATLNFLKWQVDRDIERYKSVVLKRRAAGKKGASVRWGKEA